MTERLVKIKTGNFKSLKDFEMPLGKFNVLIGPNGSGKTNVLEFFTLVRSCMFPKATPAYPFAYWSRYKNIAWSGNEHESIYTHIEYAIDNYHITYDARFIGSNTSRLEILEESLHIKDYLTVTLQDDIVKFDFDTSFADSIKHIFKIDACDTDDYMYNSLTKGLDSLKGFSIAHDSNDTSILKAQITSDQLSITDDVAVHRIMEQAANSIESPYLLSPAIKNDQYRDSLYYLATNYLKKANSVVCLRHMDYTSLRQSVPIEYSAEINEYGEGLINLLFRWFNKEQKLPESITLALEALFPGWWISFEVTQEATIIMQVRDGPITLAPASIPDGFYKLLAILAAVELDPQILLIDEIETSLHPRIIEYIIGVLKEAESTVIITTHSPLVVDSVDVEDITLMENTGHKSTCRKIKNPDELKKELAQKRIALSDSWLYGEI